MNKETARRWACILVAGLISNYTEEWNIDAQVGESNWTPREKHQVAEAVFDIRDELRQRIKMIEAQQKERTSR